jgi:D-glycero-D-manno-heptose 1,7-bisphosphate phosphatase
MRKAVFLDRDGVINSSVVINGKPYPPNKLDQLRILPNVDLAINLFKKSGYLCIVVTNQPDVARGKIGLESVDEINQFLLKHLSLDEFYACYHDDSDNCECRKPKPGSILLAAKKHNISLHQSYMIGDRWRDIEAGENAGCKTVFIDYNYVEKRPANPTYTVSSLLEAAQIITGCKNEKN